MLYTYMRFLDLPFGKKQSEYTWSTRCHEDAEYINDHKLIRSDQRYYIDETEEMKINFYYMGEWKTGFPFPKLAVRELVPLSEEEEEIENDNRDIWSSHCLNDWFCRILTDLSALGYLPPFITIKPNSNISTMKHNDEVVKCYLQITGWMDPSKNFYDYCEYAPYLTSEDGLTCCNSCGYIYDGHAQCICYQADCLQMYKNDSFDENGLSDENGSFDENGLFDENDLFQH